jgi:23S rRNA (cytosine1962-C5)-methyltransferase
MINTLTPTTWQDYELIDCGHFEKLERFGKFITRRPEPQAIWDSSLSETEWDNMAHAYFKKEKGSQEKGEWIVKKGTPDKWYINYTIEKQEFRFKLALSSFKHVGIFPEQAINWEYIAKHTNPGDKVLNLFAYTGGASIVANSAGADVSHVDSIKQVLSWARENMEASGLDNIRWVLDDAMKYIQRQVRREAVYQAIILDPPAYGRGPNGEKWQLEEQLNEILKCCENVLDKNNGYLILNLYSLGFSALIVENLIKSIFGKTQNLEVGELYILDKFDKKLPLGVYCRLENKK